MGACTENRCVGRVYGLAGAVRLEIFRAKDTSLNYLVTSIWHFTLFRVVGFPAYLTRIGIT